MHRRKHDEKSGGSALYIHIPFCRRLCPYCDFNTYAVPNVPEEAYLDALCGELALLSPTRPSRLSSIFWGGGTPSVLSGEGVRRIHTVLEEYFTLHWEELEVTLEANPDDITPEKAREISEAGINRVSLGVQSLTPRILQLLGRRHTPEKAKEAVVNLRDAGILNVSMDLIFGVPQSTTTEVLGDLTQFLSLRPAHISTYSLTVERGTPFFKAVSQGEMLPLADEASRKQYEMIIEQLTAAGYEHYEVSNFALSGQRSVHNTNYWRRGSYLGIGAGAHSFIAGEQRRSANIGQYERYAELVARGVLPIAWSETLSPEDELSELLLLGLRTSSGVKWKELHSRCEGESLSPLKKKLLGLSEEGLAVVSEENITLTREGLCIADTIIEDLIASIPKNTHTLSGGTR
ncbi:radical SAM family heme chaperone HemW [bacterium]|nr:radical SAM family heme chaperone HemW [bacterium]